MKFNFDFTMLSLDGEPLTDQGNELHAGRTAARLIMLTTEPGPDVMVRYEWATELHKTGHIDLDKAGQQAFKNLIQHMPNVSLIARGQLLAVIDKRQSELAGE